MIEQPDAATLAEWERQNRRTDELFRQQHVRAEQLKEVRADDRVWFAAHPDREYRLRQCWPVETTDVPPTGYAVFAMVHKFRIDYPTLDAQFGAPLTFDPAYEGRDDAACRAILTRVLADPQAFLR